MVFLGGEEGWRERKNWKIKGLGIERKREGSPARYFLLKNCREIGEKSPVSLIIRFLKLSIVIPP